MPQADASKAETKDTATTPAVMTPEEEAALAAQVSAEHAAKAAEQAEKDDIAAKRAATGAPVCPTCHGELVKHEGDNPYKQGAWHCQGTCGTCWAPGIKHPR